MPILTLPEVSLHYQVTGELNSHTVPVLLIHGLGSSLRDWQYQIPDLSPFFTLITLDLRGHGESTKPNHPYTVAQFTQDTVQLLDALGVQKCHLIGMSLGGMIAFQLTLDAPARVESLTIINSAPAVIFPTLKLKLAFLWRKISVRLFGMEALSQQLANRLLPKPEQASLRAIFIERWNENDPQAYLNTLHAFSGWSVQDRLGEIECPTLIISADKDYTPVSYKESYAALIKKAKLEVITDSMHITPIDQSAQLNQVLLQFLRGIPH